MFTKRIFTYMVLAIACSILPIELSKAEDISSMKMSLNDMKISVLQEGTTPNPPAATPSTPSTTTPAPTATPSNPPAEATTTPPTGTSPNPQPPQNSRQNRNRGENGWYFGIERGMNNANMSATLPNGVKANWNGSNALGSLFDLNNFTGFAGYKSSSFRIEGELMTSNTQMAIDRNNTTAAVLGSPDPNNPGATSPASTAVPPNCTATSLAAMINGYYDFDRIDKFKPFIGAGVGYATTLLRDGTVQWGSQAGFTYQVKVGVGYDISDGQEIYAQYKYLNSPAQYVNQSGQLFNTILNSNNLEIGTKI
jgi:opacity protein-like surface antigen